jgi:Phosphotransferase enzyme family
MEHARAAAFPVPSARALSETDIAMERLEGRTMMEDLGRHPWLLPRHAQTLASLHERLHSIEAPDWLPAPLGDGKAMLHLDLHPENVLLTGNGPVVIDWPNAAKGPADADIAFSWIVIAYSLPPAGLYKRALARGGRRLFVDLFLRRFDREAIASHLPATCAYRLATRELPDSEGEALRRLLEQRSVQAAPS